MKKLILIYGLLTASIISSANVVEKSEEDNWLLTQGIIGKDYKYLNANKASEYFRFQNAEVAKSLPAQVDSYTEITSSMSTPYSSFYSYRFLRDLTKSQRMELIKDIKTEKNLKGLCRSFFNSRYLIENNHVFKLDYMDKEYVRLVDFTLDKKICNNAITKVP